MGSILPFRRNTPQRASGNPRARRSSSRLAGVIGVIAVIGAGFLVLHFMNPDPPRPIVNATVLDGDSLRTGNETIRIVNVDAPELHQTCRDEKDREWACGRVARQRLAQLVARGDIVCTAQARDRFGRTLATCSARGTDDLGEAMVREGLAVNFGGETGPYIGAEDEARAAKRGLWRGTFERPQQWRDAHPRQN